LLLGIGLIARTALSSSKIGIIITAMLTILSVSSDTEILTLRTGLSTIFLIRQCHLRRSRGSRSSSSRLCEHYQRRVQGLPILIAWVVSFDQNVTRVINIFTIKQVSNVHKLLKQLHAQTI
jgi:hypothetical protein